MKTLNRDAAAPAFWRGMTTSSECLPKSWGSARRELQRTVPITVMTRGEAGSVITVGEERYEIPAAKCSKVVDPTGAGDAFRSGFVLGYKRKLPWPVVGRLASLTGCLRRRTARPATARLHASRVCGAVPREFRQVFRNRRNRPAFDVGKVTRVVFPLAET